MKTLTIEFTDDQYDRFKAAMTRADPDTQEPVEPTDEQLAAQCKREASAITYGFENGFNNPEWRF